MSSRLWISMAIVLAASGCSTSIHVVSKPVASTTLSVDPLAQERFQFEAAWNQFIASSDLALGELHDSNGDLHIVTLAEQQFADSTRAFREELIADQWTDLLDIIISKLLSSLGVMNSEWQSLADGSGKLNTTIQGQLVGDANRMQSDAQSVALILGIPVNKLALPRVPTQEVPSTRSSPVPYHDFPVSYTVTGTSRIVANVKYETNSGPVELTNVALPFEITVDLSDPQSAYVDAGPIDGGAVNCSLEGASDRTITDSGSGWGAAVFCYGAHA